MKKMEKKNKSLKFNPNIPNKVILAFDEPKTGEGEYGTWYLYGIIETINGENGFFATKILHELLQGKGLKAGAKLEITKIVNDNKTTWDVKNLGGGEVEEKSITEVIDSVANSIDASKTNKVKDLSTEQKVNIMWDAYNKKNKQPVNIGDDDLPF